MQKFITKIFNISKNLLHFCKIIIVFTALMLIFEWIEHLLNTNWSWINFIRPILNTLLKISENINNNSMNLLGAIFEYKYGIAILLLIAAHYIINGLLYLNSQFEETSIYTHNLYKKAEENLINKSLKDSIEKEELQIKRYTIAIKTRLKKKFRHKELNINIEEQNLLMNKFIMEKLPVTPKQFNDGFIYEFNDFSKIDYTLDVLFKILHSTAPIEYAMSVQINNSYSNIEKLMSLDYYGQIIMLAETSFRYKYNKFHRYQTGQLGIFQNGETTIEIHEFKEIL